MRLFATTLALLMLQTTGPALAEDNSALMQLLEASQRDKRGVMLYVHGAALGGGIVRIEGNQWVELKSQEYGRIVVRIDRIDAAAMR